MKPFVTAHAKPGDRVILRSAPTFPFFFVGRLHGTDLLIRIVPGNEGPWGKRTDCICLQKDLALPDGECLGDPGECEFNGGCMYACGKVLPAAARGVEIDQREHA